MADTSTALFIAIPTLICLLLLFIVGLCYRDRSIVKRWTSKWRHKGTSNFNALPLGRYEPMKRWSESTFTSVPQSRRRLFATSYTPSAPKVEVVLTPPPPSAEVGDDASSPHSWQARQQHRVALNEATQQAASPSPKLECDESKKWGRAAPPTINRCRRSHGHVHVQARRSGRRSRASSITETEVRDHQRALSAFQETQEHHQKSVRLLRSMDTMGMMKSGRTASRVSHDICATSGDHGQSMP